MNRCALEIAWTAPETKLGNNVARAAGLGAASLDAVGRTPPPVGHHLWHRGGRGGHQMPVPGAGAQDPLVTWGVWDVEAWRASQTHPDRVPEPWAPKCRMDPAPVLRSLPACMGTGLQTGNRKACPQKEWTSTLGARTALGRAAPLAQTRGSGAYGRPKKK